MEKYASMVAEVSIRTGILKVCNEADLATLYQGCRGFGDTESLYARGTDADADAKLQRFRSELGY